MNHLLTVVRAGLGTGRVASTPPGIDCGVDCTETYAENTPVSLTATPAAGSVLVGWSGGCTGTGLTCDLTMDAAKTVTASFDHINRAPVLDAIGDKSVEEGATLSFTVSATDADGDALTYSASNLPPGSTFDPATRSFSWTPTYAQAGSYAGVLFTVADAKATDSETITITVTDNPTPPGFYTVIPCRVLDTRGSPGPLGGPALVAGADRTFTIAGQCDIPTTALAVSVNVTVTDATAAGNLRLYPAGIPVPLVSAINYAPGATRANNAILPLSELGELAVRCSQASGTAHFILDVNGYFQGPRDGARVRRPTPEPGPGRHPVRCCRAARPSPRSRARLRPPVATGSSVASGPPDPARPEIVVVGHEGGTAGGKGDSPGPIPAAGIMADASGSRRCLPAFQVELRARPRAPPAGAALAPPFDV